MALTDLLREKLRPTDALVFYDSSEGKYVEHRSITGGKMGAGQPLDLKQFAQMVRLVERYTDGQQQMTAINGAIPQNLLYADPNLDRMRLVWWRPAEERKMFFTDAVNIPNGVMQVPGVVYSVKGGGTLSVWCFRGKRPRGVLYKAPFLNVYNDGHVCLGSSKTEKPRNNTFGEWILYWEKMFWQSEFASMIGDNPIDGNLVTVTKQCIQQSKPFPVELLKKANVKLSDLLK